VKPLRELRFEERLEMTEATSDWFGVVVVPDHAQRRVGTVGEPGKTTVEVALTSED
jgi:hypothetical protein